MESVTLLFEMTSLLINWYFPQIALSAICLVSLVSFLYSSSQYAVLENSCYYAVRQTADGMLTAAMVYFCLFFASGFALVELGGKIL